MLLLSLALYAGMAGLLAGGAGVLRPIRRAGLRTRARALVVAGGGAALCAGAIVWPAPTHRVTRGDSALDDVMPAYQFFERHDTLVRADPQAIFDAIREVTAREVRFFLQLTWIRNPLRRIQAESILAAPADRPLLGVALSSGFVVLAERPGSELVFGTMVAPRVRAVMNFRVTPEGEINRLVTETRVLAEEPRGLRAFTVYWRLIYPGSALIRVEWLRAIRRRAEKLATRSESAGGLP